MKLRRNVDGEQLVKHLQRCYEYLPVRQNGSHVRLQTGEPSRHSVTVPMHRPLKPGTLASIVTDVARHKRLPVEAVLEGL